MENPAARERLFLAFATGPVTTRQAGRHAALRWTAAAHVVAWSGAALLSAGAVAARTLIRPASALMPRAEAVRPSAWLADGELGDWARHRWLPFARQRRANERPVNRPLVLRLVAAISVFVLDIVF